MEQGTPMTTDAICETYYNLNKKYFGKVTEVDKNICMEWARIPHFYNSFYVYKYATGMSAALSISNRIYNGDTETLNKYLEFLKSGCTQYPLDQLKGVGVDFTTSKPIEEALEVFRKTVKELKDLIES
ncbi:Oligoendopeptidase F, plasmid [compost metagenome]